MPQDLSLFEDWVKAEGARLYFSFTAPERLLVSFGMLPANKAEESQTKLVKEFERNKGRPPSPKEVFEIARLLTVGATQAANRSPA